MISALASLIWHHVDRRGQTMQKEKSSTQIVEREMMSTSEEAECDTQSDMNKEETRLLQWPPQKLKNGLLKPSSILTSLLSFLIVAINATYIGILLRHDGRDIKDLGSLWTFVGQFSHLGPTVVPLMFAFVVGRAVRSYAHWRLQQGERIGTLDSLFGSTTLTGTVTTILDLKRIGGVEILLLFIWSLSPLGGQAALRVLPPANENHSSLVMLPYLDHDVIFPSKYSDDLPQDQQVPINTLVLGSLGATNEVKRSKMDTWGNVKIPMIEFFPHLPKLESDGWVSVDHDQNEVTYSALLGIPVANVSREHNSSFLLETSYLRLNCTDIGSLTDHAFQAADYTAQKRCEGEFLSSYKFKWGEMATIPNCQGVRNSTRHGERCSDPRVSARDLIYWNYEHSQSDYRYSMAKCSMTTSFVTVNVSCSGWDCGVTAIRLSAPSSRHIANRTFFDGCPQENSNIWARFFLYFDSLTDKFGPKGSPTIVQSYLVDPSLGLNASAVWRLPPIYTVGKELFSIRLGQLLNTYWLAMIGTEPLFLGHPKNYDGVTKWAVGSDTSPSNDNYMFSKTEAAVYVSARVLRYQKTWMAVLMIATSVLLLTAILDVALSLNIWVPRLLMNISTLTRGNPNFDVPAGGGALSDEARAKLLANVKVRFGDAERVDESSDLVIGNCVEHGGRVSKLTKGKIYT